MGFAQAACGLWLALRLDRAEYGRGLPLGAVVGLGVACSAPLVMLLGWGLLNMWNAGLL